MSSTFWAYITAFHVVARWAFMEGMLGAVFFELGALFVAGFSSVVVVVLLCFNGFHRLSSVFI